MSLFGAFRHKPNPAPIPATPAVPEPEAEPELEFLKARAAESADDVIRAHEEAASVLSDPASDLSSADPVTESAEEPVSSVTALAEAEEEKAVASESKAAVEKITAKVSVVQHPPVIDLPEFQPSNAPAIALIRGNEGFLAKDLVTGMEVMGSCETDARDRLITLLAQPA